MSAEFKIGDLVWAKMKGFPPWPGQVSPPVDYLKSAPKKNMLCIFFFGTNNYAWIEDINLKPYHEFKNSLQVQSKLTSFRKAVKQIEEYLSNDNGDVTASNTTEEVTESEDVASEDLAALNEAEEKQLKSKPVKRPSTSKSNNVAKKRKLSTSPSVVDISINTSEIDEEKSTDFSSTDVAEDVVIPPKKVTVKKIVKKVMKRVRGRLTPKKRPSRPKAPGNDNADMEIGTYPPNWSASPKKKVSSTMLKVAIPKPMNSTSVAGNNNSIRRRLPTGTTDEKFMDNYFKQLSIGYNTLLSIFQHLKVQDLLSAGCVCTMWRDLASHPRLWRTVRMKNSQIGDFYGMAAALERQGTKYLDLRKILITEEIDDGDDTLNTSLISTTSTTDPIWSSFSDAIRTVSTLRRIDLPQCPVTVLHKLGETNLMLDTITCSNLTGEFLQLDAFSALANLTDLRLKSPAGFRLSGDFTPLRYHIGNLRHLSLTGLVDMTKGDGLEVVGELVGLESLELGECMDLSEDFGRAVLSKLRGLVRLRLEKGQGDCHTKELLETAKTMPTLTELELINFDIKAGFDKSLGACTNLKKLLIIPTYISQSATTNHMVLGGVFRLKPTLNVFIWGVTMELLRVTELFVGQCDEKEKIAKPVKASESIPVLKPVPSIETINDEPIITDPPQVEILPLPNLQKLVTMNLPTTRFKVLKIPFQATWRQNIADSL